MVLKLGINEWPMPGRRGAPLNVPRGVQASSRTRTAFPFVPGAFWKDLVFSGAILAAVAVCAFVFGPYGPSGQPDPSIIQTVPKPDFSFLWIYTRAGVSPAGDGDALSC
jgi:ubiquinol-cytochrome c reductase cytochrome b subunit